MKPRIHCTKERARNNLSILLPLPPGEGWGEGIYKTSYFVRVPKPSITELVVRYATDAAANGWGEKYYEYINRFEEAFKVHLGVKVNHRYIELYGTLPNYRVIISRKIAAKVKQKSAHLVELVAKFATALPELEIA